VTALVPLGSPAVAYYGQPDNVTSPEPAIEVNAYILPGKGAVNALDETARHLTYVSVFSYRAGHDGELVAPEGEDAVLEAARRHGVRPQMVLTNFDGTNFSSDLGHAIVNDPALRTRVIENTLRVLREKGYHSLNIDFENLPPEDREAYTGFIGEMTAILHRAGYPLSVAVAPKAGDRPDEAWVGFVDYAALGSIVDRVIVMTYEWGWIGGPPMPIAPLDKVRGVIEYLVQHVPPGKILMGMPLYGYDWELPDTPANTAKSLDPVRARQLAQRYGARIQWDERAASPFFYYTDDWDNGHAVWFEDGWSMAAKYALVREFGLRGVSFWVLGNRFPENWAVLDGLFEPVRDRA